MMLDELKEGSILLCIKNEDGSFSPLWIPQGDGEALGLFIGSMSKENPLSVCTDIRLVESGKDKSKRT